jgi:hypothetical protein
MFLVPSGVVQTAATNQLITPPGPSTIDPLTPTDSTPWYKTPLGIGAIAIGALLAFRHFRKSK